MESVSPFVVVHIGDSAGCVALIVGAIKVDVSVVVSIAARLQVDPRNQIVGHHLDFRCVFHAPVSNLVEEDVRTQFGQIKIVLTFGPDEFPACELLFGVSIVFIAQKANCRGRGRREVDASVRAGNGGTGPLSERAGKGCSP